MSENIQTTSQLFLDEVDIALDTVSYSGPFQIIESLDSLTETDIDTFVGELTDPGNHNVLGQMMYFLRYLEKNDRQGASRIEHIAKVLHQQHIERTEGKGLPQSMARFSDDELEFISPYVRAIQSTSGCGGGCLAFCGVDALALVRDRMPIDQFIGAIEMFDDRDTESAPSLYWANDILQATTNKDDFVRLGRAAQKTFGNFWFKTSIPKGTEELYKALRKEHPDFHVQVSLNRYNLGRLKEAGIIKFGSVEEMRKIGGKMERPDDHEWFCNRLGLLGFEADYRPSGVCALVPEITRDVGINGWYKEDGKNVPIVYGSRVIVTPYAMLNVQSMGQVNKNYPQGLAVVAIDEIDDRPLDIKLGDRFEPYLRNSVLTGTHSTMFGIDFYLANFSERWFVRVNDEGIVTTAHDLHRES